MKVHKDILKSWNIQKRHGDVKDIAALLELSEPTISRAFDGNVGDSSLIKKITLFFVDRSIREKKENLDNLKKLQTI